MLWTHNLPDLLASKIERQQCVAFVGAGFSMACGMPSWKRLLESLLDEVAQAVAGGTSDQMLQNCANAIESGDYAEAADMLGGMMSPGELDEFVRRQFSERVLRDCPEEMRERMLMRMRHLVEAPWAGIITTNYDDLIEKALHRWCDRGFVTGTGSSDNLGRILQIARDEGLFFQKLHGSISSGKVVIGAEDYVRQYLLDVPINLFLTLVAIEFTHVFIGCSLEDEIVRIRQKLVQMFDRGIPAAYALLPATEANLRKEDSRRMNANIISIMYDEEDVSHQSLDEFLECCSGCRHNRLSEWGTSQN